MSTPKQPSGSFQPLADADSPLEAALAELTAWYGEEPTIGMKALTLHSSGQASPWPRRNAATDARRWFTRTRMYLAAAAILLVCAVAVSLLNWQDGSFSRVASSPSNLRNFDSALPSVTDAGDATSLTFPWEHSRSTDSGIGEPAGIEGRVARPLLGGGGGGGGIGVSGVGQHVGDAEYVDEPPIDLTTEGNRAIVRKAMMQLLTKDVQGVYLHAMHLVSEARGEYIATSAMQGAGESAEASLTLRIAVERLDAVLTELRTLGKVQHEQKTGDDVTNQQVDLEARLRNEQRVEQELLELLEKRADAPLKEILELREEIASIRGSIERTQAQAANLHRLTTFASVLILVRFDLDEVPTDDELGGSRTLGGYFGDRVSSSWRQGIEFLVDTVAWLVQTVVGGAIWWAASIVCALLAWRAHRARQAATANA